MIPDRKRIAGRRALLKLIGLGASALYVPGLAGCGPDMTDAPKANPAARPPADPLVSISPIDRTIAQPAPATFSGDEPSRAHSLLWDKDNFLRSRGGLPEPSEKVAVAIVGGGLSGLASAWQLRRHQPVVLERAPRFGGNARGEAWQGIDYAIGAAYFLKPDDATPLGAWFRELELAKLCREHAGGGPVIWRGKRHADFWKGGTDPARKAQFERVARHFRDVLDGKHGWFYPEIPVTDTALRGRIDRLDRIPLARHLRKVAGGPLHPHIEAAIEHYCWSSFGASARELSAACGLNFLAAELGTLMVCPGGNAAVAEALLKRLAAAVPLDHLRSGAIVLDVRVGNDGVQVTYEDAHGKLRALLARAVVLACPKFAVAKMLHGIEDERAAAIKRLRYNAYLVANVLLKAPVKDDFYDLFLLGEGKVGRDIREAAERQKVTDVALATYARPQPDRAALTLYRALPYAGGRPQLLADATLPQYRAEFEEQIAREILPLVGRAPADVADIRVARWGHPLPVAAAGLIADRVPERLRKPFRERVFFVEQDNWALPAFETAVTEALIFAPQVEKALASA